MNSEPAGAEPSEPVMQIMFSAMSRLSSALSSGGMSGFGAGFDTQAASDSPQTSAPFESEAGRSAGM
jgi:hypothetical protein